jgi:hypothetical protein
MSSCLFASILLCFRPTLAPTVLNNL